MPFIAPTRTLPLPAPANPLQYLIHGRSQKFHLLQHQRLNISRHQQQTVLEVRLELRLVINTRGAIDSRLTLIAEKTRHGDQNVNLDLNAPPLAEQSGNLEAEIRHWAPEIDQLTFAHRLTYDIKSNWKNVVDNFVECYHCPVAHKAFCELVEMNTYEVSTYGIYSNQIGDGGNKPNNAYDVSNATFKKQVVWWLWPNTCLIRFPGRPNFIVLHIIPAGPDRTLENLDFFFETPEPNEAEWEAIRFFDDVLQVEDIGLVESVQRGMSNPAFDQGRIVVDPNELGTSEHALHHFHGLVLDTYSKVADCV